MNIAIIGTGYVGLVTGACFSEMGNTVTCVDHDEEKINNLHKGIMPIYEPGLKEIIQNNSAKTLFFSTDIAQAVKKATIIFIAVGTPMAADGSADLSSVYAVAESIGKNIAAETIVVSKSTVPVGTTIKIQEIIQAQLTKRKVAITFHVASNPEFLKEGAAIDDFMKPDRVVIGADSDFVFKKMKELYAPFFRTHDRFITMDIHSAEMTKYAANAMLATKISFINEIANICEKVGADVNQVRIGIGSDKRIGYSFMYPGIGYGGTCFPKDIAALKKMSLDKGYNPLLIGAVATINHSQKKLFVEKIVSKFGEDLKGFTFAIWGLSFKPETDDMREAPAIYVIKELVSRGASIQAYDPKAMKVAQAFYFKGLDNITYVDSKYEALINADALILLTEWKEFRSPDFEEIKKQLKTLVIMDGRNQYKSLDLQEKGFEYYQVGKN